MKEFELIEAKLDIPAIFFAHIDRLLALLRQVVALHER